MRTFTLTKQEIIAYPILIRSFEVSNAFKCFLLLNSTHRSPHVGHLFVKISKNRYSVSKSLINFFKKIIAYFSKNSHMAQMCPIFFYYHARNEKIVKAILK